MGVEADRKGFRVAALAEIVRINCTPRISVTPATGEGNTCAQTEVICPSASAYHSSPNTDGLPKFSMNTVTHRWRNAFQAMEPLCGFTGFPSAAETRLSCGLSTSHVAASCHASKVAGHRNLGSGLPKST